MSKNQFRSQLAPAARERLLAAGVATRLARGEHLIRRGEEGGDVYVVESGTLEVVDDRFRPEVILDHLTAGDVVGDMSFVDRAPRSADIRAATDATCRRFERDALGELLDRDVEVGSAFYRALVGQMASRNREIVTTAALGALGRRKGTGGGGSLPWMTQQAGEITARARARWARARRGIGVGAENEVVEATTDLVAEGSAWLARFSDAEQAEEAGRLLSEEIHGWLARTAYGRSSAGTPGPAVLERIRAWALVGTAAGDDPIGRAIDRALLELPTFVALRRARATLLESVRAAIVAHAPRRTLMLSVNPRSLLEGVQFPGEVLLVGGAEAAGYETVLRLEVNLLALATGKQKAVLEGVDLVVIDGLFEHVPDRWAVGALLWASSGLAAGRPLLWMSAAPARDEPFVREVLAAPWIRRGRTEMFVLVKAAGLEPDAARSEDEGVVYATAR